jgi:adenylate cyclase
MATASANWYIATMEKNLVLLDSKLARVATLVPGTIRSAIADFIKQAAPHQLMGINPFALARRRHLQRIQTLKAFLHLTREGVFDLTWAVHCPHCKGFKGQVDHLGGLEHEGRCTLCQTDFEADFDRNVEVQFRLSEVIGQLGPVDSLQIALAALELEPGINLSIEPGEDHFLQTPILAGNYALVVGQAVINLTVADEADPAIQTAAATFGDNPPPIRVLALKAGDLALTIRNTSQQPIEALFARIKSPDWTDASLVASLQEFRDMFSKEMISQDEAFSIRRLAIIFTDIKASTEMYERLGDSKAYFLVKEHFKIMEEVVRTWNGGIVKTIGDAIMAVFTSPPEALAAAHEMIDRFDQFNTDRHLDHQIIIKVGIHSGACIAVTLNERLDYFGTTINTAARIQSLSDGRDIMVSEVFFADSQAGEFAVKANLVHEKFVTSLKGLKEHQTVYKLYRK